MATISIPEGMNEKEYYETVVSEEEFLRWYKEQDHPTYENPSVTADMVAYCFVEGRLKLLVIRRKNPPLSASGRLGWRILAKARRCYPGLYP